MLINIGNGFFMVKFSNREDCSNALTGGPWMIFDHYLTVRPWEPLFHPWRATIDKVAVWVRRIYETSVAMQMRRDVSHPRTPETVSQHSNKIAMVIGCAHFTFASHVICNRTVCPLESRPWAAKVPSRASPDRRNFSLCSLTVLKS